MAKFKTITLINIHLLLYKSVTNKERINICIHIIYKE